MTLFGNFLGQLNIYYKEKCITHNLPKKATALLCYIMMNNSKIHYREHLANMLWENSDNNSAKYNLRYTLWLIRKEFETNQKNKKYIISPNKNIITLNPNSIFKIDVYNFTNLLEQINKNNRDTDTKIQLMEKASALYKGDFLENFYVKNSPTFNDWIFYERENLQRLFFDLQINLSSLYEYIGSYDKAINILNKLLLVNPFHEEIYYKLMTLYSLSDDRISAIKIYDKLKSTLREELNISPMEKTTNFYKQMSLGKNTSILAKQSCSSENKCSDSIIPLDTCGLHMLFFLTPSNIKTKVMINKLKKTQSSSNSITLNITNLPGKRVAYEGIDELLDELSNIVATNNVHVSIDDSVNKIYDEISKMRTNFPIEEYTLFKYICNLLNNFKDTSIIIKIYNLHLLDDITYDFLSFIYRQSLDANIVVLGVYNINWKNERFDQFKQAFINQENIMFSEHFESDSIILP